VELVDVVEQEIRETYAGSVEIYSIKVLLNVVNNILSSVNSLMISVASVSLLVAFVGIMTTMFTAVVERTREIGLLKALGYTNNEILFLFLAEAGITGLVGGVLGTALGVVAAYARSFLVNPQKVAGGLFSITRITPVFTIDNMIFAISLAFLVGLAAGAIPAYRASRMEPVKALRYE
jgi:putative ABC transport system permease protein